MKHPQIFSALFTGVCVAVLATAAMATAPKLMSFQGQATDPSGNPVADGPHTVAFDMYNSATAGSRLWGEISTVTSSGGLFTHILGSVTPILESQFRYYEGLWLQVTFDGQVQTPRTQFTSVGYAFHVQSIHNADGGSIKGYLAIYDNTAGNEIAELYGDANGEPVLNLNGSERSIELNAGQPSNASVQFPDNAISAQEMLNEPGLAHSIANIIFPLTSAADFVDLITVDITIPSSGYIMVFGKVCLDVPTNGTAYLQIDQYSGGNAENESLVYSRAYGEDVKGNINCHRVFYKSTPGTYEFRLEGRSQYALLERQMLTAMFIPTSYGAVEMMVSAEEASQFDNAMPTQTDGKTMYKVDLRQLELRAAKADGEAERARAEAEKAQRELLRAKYEAPGSVNR